VLKMKIGLIGCGRIAAHHMNVYRFIKDTQVVAVSDVNSQKAKNLAGKYDVKNVFSNYADLLEIKSLDFVDICTPPSTHASIVCDAAEAGHNILLEKPMALSSNECEKMIHEAEKHKVSLCVCHNQIFLPAIKQAKRLVDSGDFHITSFRTSIKENPHMFSVPAWNMTEKEKGILWEAGCHPAYLQLHLLQNIIEVYAVGSKRKFPVFDEFSVLLRTSGQPYGIIEVSWLTKESEKIFEIDSSDGKRVFMKAPPPYANQGYDVLLETSEETRSGLYPKVKEVLRHFVKRKTQLGYFIGHFYLINCYIKSLRVGSPPPVKPQEGKRAIKLLECIEKSLNTHKIVPMAENQ